MNAVRRRSSSTTFPEGSRRMARMIMYTPSPVMELDAKEVRAGEQLDWTRLVAWLRERLPACGVDALDVSVPGLSVLGKPAGFVERQVRGWSERWVRSKTNALPEMDALAEWLRAHLPRDPPRPSVVHGDFKLDNVMLDSDDVGRIVA